MQGAKTYETEVKLLMTDLYGIYSKGLTVGEFGDILERAWWYRYESKAKYEEILGYIDLIKYDDLKGGRLRATNLRTTLTALRTNGDKHFTDLLTEAYWRSVVLYEQYQGLADHLTVVASNNIYGGVTGKAKFMTELKLAKEAGETDIDLYYGLAFFAEKASWASVSPIFTYLDNARKAASLGGR